MRWYIIEDQTTNPREYALGGIPDDLANKFEMANKGWIAAKGDNLEEAVHDFEKNIAPRTEIKNLPRSVQSQFVHRKQKRRSMGL